MPFLNFPEQVQAKGMVITFVGVYTYLLCYIRQVLKMLRASPVKSLTEIIVMRYSPQSY